MSMKSNNNHKTDLSTKGLIFLLSLILSLAFTLCLLEFRIVKLIDKGILSSYTFTEDEIIYEIEKQIIHPPKPMENPVKKPEFVKVKPHVNQNIQPKTNLPIKLNNELVFSEEYLEPDTIVFIDSIFDVVEENPSFPGGEKKLYEFLSKNLRYPEMAKENGIQGKVFIQFVVWKDGSIKDVKVVKSIHNTLDKEAFRVVNKMPNWSPGKQQGKVVNTKFTIPIKFKLG